MGARCNLGHLTCVGGGGGLAARVSPWVMQEWCVAEVLLYLIVQPSACGDHPPPLTLITWGCSQPITAMHGTASQAHMLLTSVLH